MRTHAKAIRDAILERLPKLPFFAKFTFKRTSAYQIQTQDLPVVAVYMMPDVMDNDGDWDAAEPKFRHTTNIGISVVIPNIAEDELEDALDASWYVITAGLLSDATFIGFQNVPVIEGVPKMTREHVYGMVGSNNETPIGEMRSVLTFRYRWDYPPDIRDDLEEIHLETVYPSFAEKLNVQQVVMPVDFTAGDSPPLSHDDPPRHFEDPINVRSDPNP